MLASREVFRDVVFSGDVEGRGRIIASPGRIKVREGRVPRAAVGLLICAALSAIILAVAWWNEWPSSVAWGAFAFLMLTLALFARFCMMIVDLGRDPYRPILRRGEYDATIRADSPEVIRFSSGDAARELQSLDIRFGDPIAARRCYELFTGERTEA